MFSKSQVLRLCLCLVLLGSVAAVSGFAGSAVVGSVAGSMNATVGGQTLLPNTTLFSGDSLQVTDGVAVVALGSSSRMVFGRDTVASFLRDSNEVTVLLSQGSVSMFQADNSSPVRVRAGSVSVVPVSGFKTLGEVAMLNGEVVVSAKEGALSVEGNGQKVNVATGKTIMISPSASAPQGGANPPTGRHISSDTAWDAAGVVVGGIGLIFSAVAMSRAGNAETNAAAADSAATAADSNALAATSASEAATAAASAATSAANAAGQEANLLGCALNTQAAFLGEASPYTPPAGYVCNYP